MPSFPKHLRDDSPTNPFPGIRVLKRRQRLAEHFRALGAEVLPSATNFIGIRLSSAALAERVNRELLGAGRLIARPAHPDLSHMLRITAVEDALVPGRLAILENAVRE